MRRFGNAMTLLIFDCDGVLVDSEPMAHALVAEMMTELGHPMTAAESVVRFGGRSVSDMLALAERILGRKVPEETGHRYGRRLLERLRSNLKPIPGVKAAIAALPFPRCIASSSSFERIRLSLEVTGLAPLFADNIFSASQVAHGKPAPDLLLFACGAMGARPGECLVIEDSPHGIAAAVAANMIAIGFTGGAHTAAGLSEQLKAAGACVVLSTMNELPATVLAVLEGGGTPHDDNMRV
jgi:HAD superfamily hydrolase (TIGR01509 family)